MKLQYLLRHYTNIYLESIIFSHPDFHLLEYYKKIIK